MHCLQIDAVDAMPDVIALPDPVPAEGEVLVRLHAAALNHRDVWIWRGRYPGLRLPVIPGSDGAGTVIAASPGHGSWIGREVVINPGFDWGADQDVQSPGFTILGLPRQGTFATHIAVPIAQLTEKPAHLDWHHAAALPLAGLTAWRALTHHGTAREGMRVLVNGIGGGVALAALQFARALGCRVAATSSDARKRDQARDLGAAVALDWRDPEWTTRLNADFGAVDLAIDGAGGDGMNRLLDAVRPGGMIVLYGATAGIPAGLELRKLFWRQIRLHGSTMGSTRDWLGMIQAVSTHGIIPVIDSVRPLAEGGSALAMMESGRQFGKLVLSTDG